MCYKQNVFGGFPLFILVALNPFSDEFKEILLMTGVNTRQLCTISCVMPVSCTTKRGMLVGGQQPVLESFPEAF